MVTHPQLIHPKSTLTAWERWELASFDPKAEAVAAPVKEVEPEAVVNHEALNALASEEARQASEAAGRAAGYEAGHTEGYAEGQRQGYDVGHAEGLAAGTTTGQATADAVGREEAARLMQLVNQLDARITALSPAVAADLLGLSLEIARQVIRQSVELRPEILPHMVHEALAQLPLQQAAIHLHPEDAMLLRRHAGEELAHTGHRIREDPKLNRGDLVIESGGSHLDASLSSRWARVVARLGHDAPWIQLDAPPNEISAEQPVENLDKE